MSTILLFQTKKTYLHNIFFFSSRRRHTRFSRDWSSDVCSSDLGLPGGQRVVVLLKDVYGLSCREIGEEIGIEEGAVKVRLHRARKRLKEALDEPDEQAGPV